MAERGSLALALVIGVFVGGVLGWALWGSDDGQRSNLAASDVDIGFLQDMSDHHAQAIVMAAHQLRRGDDETVKEMAFDILTSQTTERGQMGAMLADRGAGPGSPDRLAMAWMGVGVPVEEMAGMVPVDKLNQLLASEGAELDLLFLELMSDHHIGGVHMAEHAAEETDDPRIRDMALRMALDQEAEIVDIALLLGRG